MSRFARIVAAPIVSAGVAAAALGLAGSASAGMPVRDDGMVAVPDTRAHRTITGYHWPTHAYGLHTDTAVHQSR